MESSGHKKESLLMALLKEDLKPIVLDFSYLSNNKCITKIRPQKRKHNEENKDRTKKVRNFVYQVPKLETIEENQAINLKHNRPEPFNDKTNELPKKIEKIPENLKKIQELNDQAYDEISACLNIFDNIFVEQPPDQFDNFDQFLLKEDILI